MERKDKDEKFFTPLGLVESLTSLRLFPCRVNLACPTASKLTSNSGVIREYTSATSLVFPYSPEVIPTLALASLSLRFSHTRILPHLPIAAKDDNSVYAMNQTGDKVQVFISNSAGVNIQEWERKPETLEPGDYAVCNRKYGFPKSAMAYKLDYNCFDVFKFVPEPTAYVACPGEISTKKVTL